MISLKTSSSINRIQHAFSKAALVYDEKTQLHRQTADQLVQEIVFNRLHPKSILDIGCGTGYLTSQLKSFFPASKITGSDFAPGMIRRAQEKYKNVQWVLADARHLPFTKGSYSLAVSNLAYQWVDNLPQAFLEIRRVLAKDGFFAANLLGYWTCEELFYSLKSTTEFRLPFTRFARKDDIQAALESAGFTKIKVINQSLRLEFKNLWDVFQWLKTIGANRLTPGFFLGPKALHKANEYCLKNYPLRHGVGITFDIISIRAYK